MKANGMGLGLALAMAVLPLAGCIGVETFQTYYETPVPAAQSKGWHVVAVDVSVPDKLTVSEEHTYEPKADIVWREDPIGDRHPQDASADQGGHVHFVEFDGPAAAHLGRARAGKQSGHREHRDGRKEKPVRGRHAVRVAHPAADGRCVRPSLRGDPPCDRCRPA